MPRSRFEGDIDGTTLSAGCTARASTWSWAADWLLATVPVPVYP